MSKADLLLKKAASFEKLAIYSDRKTFLQAVAQQYGDPNTFSQQEVEQWESQKSPKSGIPTPPSDPGFPMNPPPAMNAPAPREQGKPAPAMQKIDPAYQKLLGVTVDGLWGPETQRALDAYKAKINQPGVADGTALALLRSNSG